MRRDNKLMARFRDRCGAAAKGLRQMAWVAAVWSMATATLCPAYGVEEKERRGPATVVDRPPTGEHNDHYVGNRAPLQPDALLKLPVGSIRPRGWLRKQLRLQADGFHGHLGEISGFLRKEGNSWLDPQGRGDHGWEESPYWLKGYLNCAYVLGDEKMIAEAKVWIEGALGSRKPDGWFGPDEGRKGIESDVAGRDDLWPNMIMLCCLQDYYSATGDKRVIELMARYFKYLHGVPEDKYLLGWWPKMRGGDNLYSIYWLYNRTGDKWLLELAEKNHRRTARWDEDIIYDWHNVNISQCFGEGATWWLQSHDPKDLQSAYRNWRKVRDTYGQVPGGMFGGDEGCRPGYDDPRQCIETCGIVEKMHSDEALIAITGDLLWADGCEDAAYNMLPAALTADFTAVRYLTAPNQVVSDRQNHNPGINNVGSKFDMNPWSHRCCQHNCGQGWPYFAEHLWYATPDNGLAAVFYNDCTVTAKVADGKTVTIDQATHYPFDEKVTLTIQAQAAATFPLYLRVPGWCERPTVAINGKLVTVAAKPRQFIVITRQWDNGDKLELTLPMKVRFRVWEKNHHSVSVDRGPLTYSLKIGENYVRFGGSDRWPATEIYPTTPWNYGLVLDREKPEDSRLKVHQRDWPADDMPWTQTGTPLQLEMQAQTIPQWTLDQYGLCAVLQDSPVKSNEKEETIMLIPMGAARLRISSFPVIGVGEVAHEWSKP